MKKIVPLLAFAAILFQLSVLKAQSPAFINYQAVARNASGNALPNQQITVRLTIHNNTPNGAFAYLETDTVTTNQFGLFTIAIGKSTIIPGGFSGIAWGSGNKYLQVEIDPAASSSFVDMGTTQILSVPYALYAEYAENTAPTGQSSTNYYGSGLTFVTTADTAYKPINGLLDTINVPAGVTTILQTTGYAYAPCFSAFAQIQVALYVDGTLVSPGGNEAVTIVTDDNISSGGGNWSINRPVTLSPGSHTVQVKVKGQSQSQCSVTIDNNGFFGNSVLTVTFLKN